MNKPSTPADPSGNQKDTAPKDTVSKGAAQKSGTPKSGTQKGGTKAGTKPKRRSSAVVPSGIVNVKATFNNTIITITDPSGKVISWASAGKVNFSGSRKSSAFAATVAAQDAGKNAASQGMKEVEVYLNGPGAGRESAVRGIQSAGLQITEIRDVTPVPHNGCRARKRRRV